MGLTRSGKSCTLFFQHHFSQPRDGLAILYLGGLKIDVLVVTVWPVSFQW